MSSRESDRISSAQQTLDSAYLLITTDLDVDVRITVLYDISQLLNTQLDKETLVTCVGMIESGVNPEALAVCLIIALVGLCVGVDPAL